MPRYEPDLDWEWSLIGAMREDLAEAATPDMVDEMMVDLLDSLTLTEAFDFGKALAQIQKGASAALADPTVRQITQVALPAAGGMVGGPLGATLAARAVASGPGPPTKAPTTKQGPSAATKGLVAVTQPSVLTQLLAAAMGERGRQTVNGVPNAALLSTLSSLFGQAAAEADELARGSTGPAYVGAGESFDDWTPRYHDDAVYESLLAAESREFEEVWP
jgi:hypothetical protein